MTACGEQLYETFRDHEKFVGGLVSTALNNCAVKRKIRVLLPTELYLKSVAQNIAEFISANPEITLEIGYHNISTRIDPRRFEVAISLSLPADETQNVEFMCNTKAIAYCSSKYIAKYGQATTFTDMERHKGRLVGHMKYIEKSQYNLAIYKGKIGEIAEMKVMGNIFTDSTYYNYDFLESGDFFTIGSASAVHDDLLSGKFVQMFPEYYFGTYDFFLFKSNSRDPLINKVAHFLKQCVI